jgi:hypothetical protein
MSQINGIAALEAEWQLRGVPFDRGSLLAFGSSAWPLMLERPDVGVWATEFLKAGSVAWM